MDGSGLAAMPGSLPMLLKLGEREERGWPRQERGRGPLPQAQHACQRRERRQVQRLIHGQAVGTCFLSAVLERQMDGRQHERATRQRRQRHVQQQHADLVAETGAVQRRRDDQRRV